MGELTIQKPNREKYLTYMTPQIKQMTSKWIVSFILREWEKVDELENCIIIYQKAEGKTI
jgi:hypothetical protein